ncbi:kelch-like protein 41a [Drosophila albomicans]|uniref:Kelch-like protein 41a n=1 Tax=Drosophila albomicans TaxID=7291 RepID=A0A6P8WTB0_DROAB|nr:kelch-like protein 41a [Drosophila albomicans]
MCTTSCDIFKKMLEDTDFADCVIIVDSEEFKCHKMILSCNSEFFKRMFLSDFKESSGRIELQDVTPKIFTIFRNLIYTHNSEILDELDFEDVVDLFKCAHMYQALCVLKKCEDKLCFSMVNEHNYLAVFELAHKYANICLISETFTVRYNYSTFAHIEVPKQVLQFDLEIFKQWISKLTINVTLSSRYRLIYEYMSYQIKKIPKDERNVEEINNNFDDVLKVAGFKKYPMGEIDQMLEEKRFYTDEQCIIMYNLIEMQKEIANL